MTANGKLIKVLNWTSLGVTMIWKTHQQLSVETIELMKLIETFVPENWENCFKFDTCHV